MHNKIPKWSRLNLLIILATVIFSGKGYSMLCPTNFNTIDVGYTMDQVIQLCGNPDERDEEKETITYSTGGDVGQAYGSYYQAPNSYYSQGVGGYQQLNDAKER